MCTLDEEIVPFERNNPATSVEKRLLKTPTTNTKEWGECKRSSV